MAQDGGEVALIKEKLENIQSRIAAASLRVGRDPALVRLVAVTKQMPLSVVRSALAASLRCFGENYPEQAVEKITALEGQAEIEWHMIGHIQSRKADLVCQYFDMVHSVDRLKIARYLDRYCGELGKIMPILIEVNLSGEASKSGFPAWDEARWPELIASFQEIAQMPHLQGQGLMAMPPLMDDPEQSRPLYQKLRRLQDFLRDSVSEIQWDELSIGTSFDYEVAVEEGATLVRIGTELFGARPAV